MASYWYSVTLDNVQAAVSVESGKVERGKRSRKKEWKKSGKRVERESRKKNGN
jgi:hypothetical protein